ncbi:hypothetical protein TSUD_317500 [Trifolium subterraneum]|uniref:RNase H type-1 domain-containing protein n=1 Tax=Trifolium subterraneum TaxID=3900 RepID=A0A2Z6MNC7_TRISU|nr:hypothetical protein TSUD_317500 [Trifolium subterraneum]
MMNSFWWGGGANNKGIQWLAWDRMAYPKALGGMGFRDLYTFNLAMIAKQGWNIMTKPHTLVAKLYKARARQTKRLGINFGKSMLLQRPKIYFGAYAKDAYRLVYGYKKEAFRVQQHVHCVNNITKTIGMYNNVHDVLFDICTVENHDVAGTIVMLVWTLWSNRNNSFQQGLQATEQQQHITWQKPPLGWYKCNVDAGFHQDVNKSSGGRCLRDHMGVFVAAETAWAKGSCAIVEGEAYVLLKALKGIEQRGLTHVIFETDSKSVVDAIQNIHHGRSEFSYLISHIKRQANMITHTLARAAISWSSRCTFEQLPHCITILLHNEMI